MEINNLEEAEREGIRKGIDWFKGFKQKGKENDMYYIFKVPKTRFDKLRDIGELYEEIEDVQLGEIKQDLEKIKEQNEDIKSKLHDLENEKASE